MPSLALWRGYVIIIGDGKHKNQLFVLIRRASYVWAIAV